MSRHDRGFDFSFSATTGVVAEAPVVRLDVPLAVATRSPSGANPETMMRGAKGVRRAFYNPTTKVLSIWYEKSKTGAALLYRRLRDDGFETGTETMHLRIGGLYCAGCIAQIESALRSVPGVVAATFNPASSEASIEFRAGATDLGLLESAVNTLGFLKVVAPGSASPDAAEDERDDARKEYAALMRKWWFAAAIGLFTMAFSYPQLIPGLRDLLPKGSDQLRYVWMAMGVGALAVMVYSGSQFFAGMWQSLKHRTATMHTLIALGTGVAWVYST
ncbi:MAG TPA: cation transporter, partial [Spirochaetia bacterium]